MVHVLPFKCIHVLTMAGLAQSVERMNAERDVTSWISSLNPGSRNWYFHAKYIDT